MGGQLAVAIGMKACTLGYRTLFASAGALLTSLTKACSENRPEEKLKQLSQPKRLIIDEIGYLPLDRQSASFTFQLVSRRYEKGLVMITSNQSLTGWGDVFGDPDSATVILDRLLHHAVTIKGRKLSPEGKAKGRTHGENQRRRDQ